MNNAYLRQHSPAEIAARHARQAEREIAYASNAQIVEGVKGVCSQCQSGHPVVLASPTGNGWDDYEYEALRDDHEQYVMAPHSMFADIYADPEIRKENPHLLMCDGVGTMPQAVYRDKK